MNRDVHYTKYPEWFIEELANEEDKQKARDGILPHSTIVSFLCSEHGAYDSRVSNHIDFRTMLPKSRCPKCSRIERGSIERETKRRSRPEYPEWFINELTREEDKEKARSKQLTSSDIVSFLCPIHGVYEKVVSNHIKLSTGEKKRGCPKCAATQRIECTRLLRLQRRPEYPEWFINELANEEDKEKARRKEITFRDYIQFLCPIHGVYNQRVADHLNYKTGEKKQGCPSCGRRKQAQSKIESNKKKRCFPEWFINDIAKEEDKQRALSKELIWFDKIDFICPIHGVYSQRVDAHIFLRSGKPNQGCPSCGISISYGENEIYSFVQSICKKVERRNRTLIKNPKSPKFSELDIYIPDKKIAIEYNGSYWHGENYHRDKESHFEKFRLCANKDIRLITIFDKDWKENRDKIKMFLFYLISPKIEIFNRDTEVRRISSGEAREFYKSYYLKDCNEEYTVSYGLFYKDLLVSSISFYQVEKENTWNLVSYCSRFEYNIIGGIEKLFQYFIKDFSTSTIIAYSDCDYFLGESYQRLGFSRVDYLYASYYWAKSDNVFLDRDRCSIDILKEKYPELYNESIVNNVSDMEEYIMHRLGFYKVYRCGYQKWVWNKKNELTNKENTNKENIELLQAKKIKTLEDCKTLYIGRKFNRLTILDIVPYYRKLDGKKSGFSALCRCDCGKKKIILLSCILRGTTTSCGCLQKEKAKNNIKQALKWNEEHPEEMKKIRDKGVSKMLEWQKEHPEEAKEQKLNAVKEALKWREEHPEECKEYLNQAHQWQKEHPEEFAKNLENNIKQAHKWNDEHSEKMKKIRDKGISKMSEWQKEHSEYMVEQRKEAIKKAQQWNRDNPEDSITRIQVGKRKDLLNKSSNEEQEIYSYLTTLGYPVERQVLLEGHYFDFKINDFLIEYNGSVYHCSEYCNKENPEAKLSMQNFKTKNYHKELRDIAIRNNYHLIQIWDYEWINRKDFVQRLLKEQLSNTANYKDYLEENNLLNNDYGFIIEGEQIESMFIWVSTADPKQIVKENYTKGRILIYNSGYTKII